MLQRTSMTLNVKLKHITKLCRNTFHSEDASRFHKTNKKTSNIISPFYTLNLVNCRKNARLTFLEIHKCAVYTSNGVCLFTNKMLLQRCKWMITQNLFFLLKTQESFIIVHNDEKNMLKWLIALYFSWMGESATRNMAEHSCLLNKRANR